MPKNNRTNYHNYLGAFPQASLPVDVDVEAGDTAFNTDINDLMKCTSIGPVVWDVVGSSLSTAVGSLNDAYNNGGAGAGRTINVNSGEVDLNLVAGTKAISVRIAGGEIASINSDTNDGLLELRRSTGGVSSDYKVDGVDYLGGLPVTMSSSSSYTIDAGGELSLESTANIRFDSAGNNLTLEQNSVNFGVALLNGAAEIFNSGGSVGSVVGETSTSIVHALNSLGNALSTILGSNSDSQKNAVQNIPLGAETLLVTFSSAFPSANYSVVATVENNAATFEHITAVVKNKTASGFTVSLSNQVNSGDYKVNWIARIN